MRAFLLRPQTNLAIRQKICGVRTEVAKQIFLPRLTENQPVGANGLE